MKRKGRLNAEWWVIVSSISSNNSSNRSWRRGRGNNRARAAGRLISFVCTKKVLEKGRLRHSSVAVSQVVGCSFWELRTVCFACMSAKYNLCACDWHSSIQDRGGRARNILHCITEDQLLNVLKSNPPDQGTATGTRPPIAEWVPREVHSHVQSICWHTADPDQLLCAVCGFLKKVVPTFHSHWNWAFKLSSGRCKKSRDSMQRTIIIVLIYLIYLLLLLLPNQVVVLLPSWAATYLHKSFYTTHQDIQSGLVSLSLSPPHFKAHRDR